MGGGGKKGQKIAVILEIWPQTEKPYLGIDKGICSDGASRQEIHLKAGGVCQGSHGQESCQDLRNSHHDMTCQIRLIVRKIKIACYV